MRADPIHHLTNDAPFCAAELRDRHRANWARIAGVTKAGKPKTGWIQQGARHSFRSYWLALHEDIDRLVIQSGYESKEVMWRNYYPGDYQSEKPRSFGASTRLKRALVTQEISLLLPSLPPVVDPQDFSATALGRFRLPAFASKPHL
jgi:hypothetical protein